MTEQQSPRVADRIDVPGRPVRVTFFEDRAEVLRTGSVRVPSGVSWLRFNAISLVVDDPSATARTSTEGVAITNTRVVRRVRQVAAASPERIEQLEADARGASRAVELARGELSRAELFLAQARRLIEQWAAGIARVPRGGKDAIDEWNRGHEQLCETAEDACKKTSALGEKVYRAQVQETMAGERLREARKSQPRYEATIEVQVQSNSEQVIAVEVSYRTACALWRPEHLARLDSSDGKPKLQLTSFATVWQMTGEDWTDIECRFSTARPARSAAPPLLTEDVIASRRKTEAERRTVVVTAQDKAISTAGLERGVRTVEDMPGVDDGGEALSMNGLRPATIPSDGNPVRIEVRQAELACEVDWIAYPELSEAVHVRATATLSGASPLLAGPVRVGRGSELTGRGRTAFVAAGEPFELGLGVDEGLRVRRTVEEKRETTAVLGTQRINKSVRVFVSNLGDEARGLIVIERFPVSEIEDVQVSVTRHEDAALDERDGFARFMCSIEPGETRTLRLEYRVEAGAKVQLTF